MLDNNRLLEEDNINKEKEKKKEEYDFDGKML